MTSEDEVAREFSSWLSRHWDPDLPLRAWRGTFVDSGWSRPSWETDCFGRAMPAWSDRIVAGELAAAGAVGLPISGASFLAAETIHAHGAPELRGKFLRALLTGEDSWCQLFSEPGAGSDLASLSARAERDGDQWIVNGQKSWTTSAHYADMGMLLARTGTPGRGHDGITFFLLPMKQDGVEVRPVVQMNYRSSFNDVFLTNARISAANIVGAVGEGWPVAMTTLGFERKLGALSKPSYPAHKGRTLGEAQAEADEYFETYSWYPQRAGRVDLLVEHAVAKGRADDPEVRLALADVLVLQRVYEWTKARAATNAAGPELRAGASSIGKLLVSEIARRAANVHHLISGPDAVLEDPDAVLDGLTAEILLSVPAQSIAGGTDEIQRTILGERVLGLPREPRPGDPKAGRE
jgi:alkylation response protein AidB-like acyl-CoA dehydrogenase